MKESTALAASSSKSRRPPRTDHLAPHQWKPGQSGNPAGLAKGTSMKEMRAICRANFSVAADRLLELMKSQDERIALDAVQFAYLYALGKPQEGRDVAHQDTMQARHQELVAVPIEQAQLPAPPPEPEPITVTPEVEVPSLPPEPPPEAGERRLPPLAAPSGLRCLYRGKEGQCAELAAPGIQWCQPHRTKLFATLEAT